MIGILPLPEVRNSTISFFFDLGLIATAILYTKNRVKYSPFLLAITGVAYFATNFTIFYANNYEYFSLGNFADFIIANKFIIYISIVLIFSGSRQFTPAFYKAMAQVLMWSMLIKYGYARVSGFDDRPNLFLENNFELLLLLTFFTMAEICRVRETGSASYFNLFIVACVVLLSGSRSASLAIIPIVATLFIKSNWKHLIISVIGGCMFLLLLLILFQSRSSSLEEIDRFVFMMVFFESIQDFDFWNYMFGTLPMTPLPAQACDQLSYYKNLFSVTGSGQCYSVILHSMFLRVFYDHGFFGLLFGFGGVYYAFKHAGFTWRERMAIWSLPMVSALSISSIGSVLLILPLTMAAGWLPPKAPGVRPYSAQQTRQTC